MYCISFFFILSFYLSINHLCVTHLIDSIAALLSVSFKSFQSASENRRCKFKLLHKMDFVLTLQLQIEQMDCFKLYIEVNK